MKKLLVILAIISIAVSSCKPSAEEIEKEITGSWLLSGSADFKWQTIEKMGNNKRVEAIEERLTPEERKSNLDIGNRKIAFAFEGLWGGSGTYVINEDGLVIVSWSGGEKDTYWMYVKDDQLYMIEFDTDSFGDISGVQTVFKFNRKSRKPFGK